MRRMLLLLLLLSLAACSVETGSDSAESTDSAETNPEPEVIAQNPTAPPATAIPTNTALPSTATTAPPTATPTTAAGPADHLPVLGVAPPINNEVWLNIEEATTLAEQEGKVVLVEFWTFG